ncbi:MAG: hypothetical protein AAFX79_05480 [Planctomycetota bacterium]
MAFDRVGDRYAIVEIDASGGRPRLVSSQFADDPPAEIESGRLVAVAPWSGGLVRTRPLEPMASDALGGALAVLAEGELPERVPAWRRACGALPADAGGGSGRTAVLTAWMPHDDDPRHPGCRFVSAGAALGYAATLAGGCVAAQDAASGVLAVAASGPEGLVIRTLHEDAATGDPIASAARRLDEACAAAGIPASAGSAVAERLAAQRDDRRIAASDDLDAIIGVRLAGWSSADHRSAMLLPAVAGLLALEADPHTRALVGMRCSPPEARPTLAERADELLSSPRRVAAICAACIAIVLLAPLMGAMARQGVLSARLDRAEAAREAHEETARQAALYRQLDATVLPMSKMLAEVTAAAPVHVVLESVRADARSGIEIEGYVFVAPDAPPLDGPPEGLVTEYEAALNALGTLSGVTIDRRETTDGTVTFQLSCAIRDASARATLGTDYAATPLAVVLYGERGRNDTAPLRTRDADAGPRRTASSSAATRRPARPPAGDSDADRAADSAGGAEVARAANTDRRPSGESPPSVDGVPTPLTDVQLDSMDRGELMREWQKRLRASRDESNDEETRARLAQEASTLRERFRSMGSGG